MINLQPGPPDPADDDYGADERDDRGWDEPDEDEDDDYEEDE